MNRRGKASQRGCGRSLSGMGDLQVALRRVAIPGKNVALRALISVGDLEIAAPRNAICSGVQRCG